MFLCRYLSIGEKVRKQRKTNIWKFVYRCIAVFVETVGREGPAPYASSRRKTAYRKNRKTYFRKYLYRYFTLSVYTQ